MSYRQLSPCSDLAPYIDAYWVVTGKKINDAVEKIMPDGCIDIILNLGEDCHVNDSNLLMKNRHAYLVGTMTCYKEITRPRDTNLVGIRFKPAAFSFFYKYSSLHEIADKTVEFDKKSFPEINEDTTNLADCLNRFFTNRLSVSYPGKLLLAIIEDATNLKGQITVDALAKRHFISLRWLERYFKLYTGISPKEFINFVRYQSVLEKIRNNHTNKSLLEIAFESGYYDHAHLSNEIKKYTGSTPSEL
jgi:AraC-like DNA-binding protein